MTKNTLTAREQELVRLANQDPDNVSDGPFYIDANTFDCDRCGTRLPHNGKTGDGHVTACRIQADNGIYCALCDGKN